MGAKKKAAKGILQSFAGDAMTGYFKGILEQLVGQVKLLLKVL